MTVLPDFGFRYSYGPSDDRVNDFYVPALSASVRYDRTAGFFSSTALAVAATGVARLIANGGQMRLLVGAQLSQADVEAIRQGYDLRQKVDEVVLRDFDQAVDEIARDRLGALAWMIHDGHLDIKVVLPLGPDGAPASALDAIGYYHPKTGVFTDADGNQLAFSGSSNESQTAWLDNYEEFFVFRSWEPEGGRVFIREAIGRFERLWSGRESGWVALDIPAAARDHLLRYRPNTAPQRDPRERPPQRPTKPVPPAPAGIGQRQRIIAQFLRDAPHLIGATTIGAATSAVTPWPHQRTLTHEVAACFPRRYLITDEVGLGKTIEAGLILRQLLLSGTVRRALILVPKAVLKQWQEEVYEKFALNVPRYDGAVFIDAFGETSSPDTANPWDGVEVALASSQLVKRPGRQTTLLAARPWDLVLVDEAHHARRKDFLNLNVYRPNRLLELLNALQVRTQALLLMTATPMQVHPVEVWDLANLLGLSGDWAASAGNFLRFFSELRKVDGEEPDWDFVFRLVRQEVAVGGIDPRFEARERAALGPVGWSQVTALVQHGSAAKAIKAMPPPARAAAVRLAEHHTPLRRLMYRNTRTLLRQYHARGLLKDNVPTRRPDPVWVPMRPEEEILYLRIEEYIGQFYRKYEQERVGLGFVMTVYRRRLTSSFYAVRRSLERRLAFLRGDLGAAAGAAGLDDDDVEEADLMLDLSEDADLADRARYCDEIEYVEDFLRELRALGAVDSKVEQLVTDVATVFKERDTVLVFTQYTDTMDFLRDHLRQQYGPQVACYSGRGGERWDGIAWVPVTKEAIKTAFRKGDEVKILVCTEAASEGLNLQTCGVLVNFDMPWNPMRVEQRIGRIDRIGQRYPEVWIRNYFYEGTVEARVYQALELRIDWFQTVVGQLQPILARVGQAIRTVAMAPGDEREQVLEAELGAVEHELDRAASGLDIDALADRADVVPDDGAPVTLAALQSVLLGMPVVQDQLSDHDSIPKAYWLQLDGTSVAVTFDARCYDDHPDSVQLLTYGNPLFARLLATIDLPSAQATGCLLRVSTDRPLPRVAYFRRGATGTPQRLNTLAELEAALDFDQRPMDLTWPDATIASATADLRDSVVVEALGIAERRAILVQAKRGALASRGRQVLLHAALIEIALGQRTELGSTGGYLLAFHNQAVLGLARHGYPWAPLLKLVDAAGIEPRPSDPFFLGIQSLYPDRLRAQFSDLRDGAAKLVGDLAAMREVAVEDVAEPYVVSAVWDVTDPERGSSSASVDQ